MKTKITLNEDLFPSFVELEPLELSIDEIEPEGPTQGIETGIANIIHDLIIDENEAIQGYNNAKANMEQYPELINILNDIANEEFNHIGMLEKALSVVSPNEEKIDEGELEATQELSEGFVDPEPSSPEITAERLDVLEKAVQKAINQCKIIQNTTPVKISREVRLLLIQLNKNLDKVQELILVNDDDLEDKVVEDDVLDEI